MQRGIESFFKKKISPQPSTGENTKSNKRRAQPVSSDDEEVSLKPSAKPSSFKKCRLANLKSPKLENPVHSLNPVNPADKNGSKTMRSEKHTSANVETIKNENFTISNESVSVEIKKEIAAKKKGKVQDNKIKKFEEASDPKIAKTDKNEKKGSGIKLNSSSYITYQNRPSCFNPGSKEMPKGESGCLFGLTFLATGIFESFERDEIYEFISNLGGKINKTVGKKLNFLIAGEESGPKKIQDAKKHGIHILGVDALFDMVRLKSKNQNSSSDNSDKSKAKVLEIQENIASSTQCAETTKSIIACEVDRKLALVDKYKPASTKEIIGQQGVANNVQKLKSWLMDWFKNQTNINERVKTHKTSGWVKNDGSNNKAVLLSGPPGVGKTTTAVLVCKELCFDVVELNASDTRNKRLLKEEVSELLTNKSLYSYIHGDTKTVSKKHVLIMDEVDGMAGNEDRGGLQELISFIKESSVPIICICNDRSHHKMRSLVNYCYDLRFNKPNLGQIKGKILSICFRENIKLAPTKIEHIILATNNDIRQTLNHIAFVSAQNDQHKVNQSSATYKTNTPLNKQTSFKDIKLGTWEIIRQILVANENNGMNLYEKIDLFFHDYSMMPLFVQQNYLQTTPAVPKSIILENMALASDSLSMSDVVDRCIRSSSSWSLLPTLGLLSFVFPGDCMRGSITGQINFPAWLGKYSRYTKRKRLSQEIYDHTRMKTSGSRLSLRMDYAPSLLYKITYPLQTNGLNGVSDTLATLNEYRLLRVDIESLVELASWNNHKSSWDGIDSRVKSALTRAYNKSALTYSYSTEFGQKKKKEQKIYEITSECHDNDEVSEEESTQKDEIIKQMKITCKKVTSSKL